MKPNKNQSPMTLLRPFGRIFPLFLAIAMVIGSAAEASALGKRSKPWSRGNDKSKAEQRSSTATANVASKKSSKPKLFSRIRESRAKRLAAKPAPKPQTQSQSQSRSRSQRVSVRATTEVKPERSRSSSRSSRTASSRSNTSTNTKKREGLLKRIFKPGPVGDNRSSASGNNAVRKKRQTPSGPVAPNSVQSAPKYNQALLSQARSRGSSVVVNIARQRAYLYVGGKVALDTPISTARSGKRTPRGSFGVGQRVRQGKISTIYKVEMPYWMRLGQTAYGMHAGYLPGYPASAGCIRMPYQAAQKMYDATGHGTRVRIIGG